MKAVYIIFNQTYFESVMSIMDYCNIQGFTHQEDVKGRGSHTGEPHYGSHAWPTLNHSIWTIIEPDKVPQLLTLLKRLDQRTEQQGLRAFVLPVEDMI
ncbi:MAG: hypothetical protein LUF04_04375 [Bacteroides sp.]|nr:hypothetical protein [Bacteroides sp.]